MNARRNAVLREMGLAPLWRLRMPAGGPGKGAFLSNRTPEQAPSVMADARASPDQVTNATERDQGTAASLRGRVQIRDAVGAAGRGEAAAPPASAPSYASPQAPAVEPVAAVDPARVRHIATLDWDALDANIRGCTACRLCEQRKQAVPGSGDRQADWMLIGEGPGAEEDRRGEPFVGQAGKLLDAMLAALGLARGQGVYITNAVKCRPPLNRTPASDEIAACRPFLERQIALVSPKVLLALGRPAAQALLGRDVRINAVRGKAFSYGNVPVVVTYHPAYLLRNPADKGKSWEDLCFAMRLTTARALER